MSSNQDNVKSTSLMTLIVTCWQKNVIYSFTFTSRHLLNHVTLTLVGVRWYHQMQEHFQNIYLKVPSRFFFPLRLLPAGTIISGCKDNYSTLNFKGKQYWCDVYAVIAVGLHIGFGEYSIKASWNLKEVTKLYAKYFIFFIFMLV